MKGFKKAKKGADLDALLDNAELARENDWGNLPSEREALPIKQNGKVLRVIVKDEGPIAKKAGSDEDEDEDENDGGGSGGEFDDLPSSGSEKEDDEEDAEGYDFKAGFLEDNKDFKDWEDGNIEDDDDDGKKDDDKGKKKIKKKRKPKKIHGQDSDSEVDEEAVKADIKDKRVEQNKANKKDRKSRNENEHVRRMRFLGKLPIAKMQAYIGSICSCVVNNPQIGLKRRKAPSKSAEKGEDGTQMVTAESGKSPKEWFNSLDDADYKLMDLFHILTANSSSRGKKEGEEQEIFFSEQVLELTMLSALLVFKDICPEQRIRPESERQSLQDVTLKKDTKNVREFELALLGAYEKYLKTLGEFINAGLGNVSKTKNKAMEKDSLLSSSKKSKSRKGSSLGLSALRCVCELLSALPNFNFRQGLLKTIVVRAAQPSSDSNDLACQSLIALLEKDTLFEASYETISMMAQYMLSVKFAHIPENFIKVLEHANLTVKADASKSLKMAAKRERRKRKRAQDETLETTTKQDTILGQKLQANCLHEVSLVYFRLIKNKIGFRLLGVALEGISKIAHLLNIETMEELLQLLRKLLEKESPDSILPPASTQLQCLSCALKILDGPGEALNFDIVFFSNRLAHLIIELPVDYPHWHNVLDCVQICAMKRRETPAPVSSYVKLLLYCASQKQATIGGVTLLSMVHAMLVRYPSLRDRVIQTAEKGKQLFEEDGDCSDMAMAPLLSGNEYDGDAVLQQVDQDNGAWMLPLLRLHIDPMTKHTVEAISKKEITPLPLRIYDAAYSETAIINRMEAAVDNTPPVLKNSNAVKAQNLSQGKGKGNFNGKKREKTHARGWGPKRDKKKN